VVTAFDATGLPRRLDQNGEFEDGIFPPAFSNHDDRRVSTAAAYLDGPTRARPNLEIMSESTVTDLVVAEGRAGRIIIRRRDDSQRSVAVAGRVILAAGALQSPAILMRSGIGPGEHLRALGIDVVKERPGVGANLRDHPALTFSQVLPRHLRLVGDFRRASLVALRYSSGIPGGTPSDMYMTASARAGWHALGSMLALHFLWVNRPYSVGSLRLASPKPEIYPVVDLNLLADERDLLRLADGVRRLAGLLVNPALNVNADDLFPAAYTPRIRRLSAVSRLNRYATALLARALDVPAPLRGFILKTFLLGGVGFSDILRDENLLRDFIRRSVFGVWHPSGTCRMGRPDDPLAVVDTGGRVIGTENVVVGDASVMPRLPTANTNIPTIMIAEKISDHLRKPS
jgi:5-(hydroxymethyl)furfural/furfural oxidase